MKRAFEMIKNIEIVRPLDSKVDYETTIGEYYEGACEDIYKGIERLEKLEKVVEILKREYIEIDVKNVGPLTVGNHYFTIGFNGTETKINIAKEEYELLKEIFG